MEEVSMALRVQPNAKGSTVPYPKGWCGRSGTSE